MVPLFHNTSLFQGHVFRFKKKFCETEKPNVVTFNFLQKTSFHPFRTVLLFKTSILSSTPFSLDVKGDDAMHELKQKWTTWDVFKK